jgi:hypothetical protein
MRKEQLQEEAQQYKKNLLSDLDEVKSEGKKWATVGLAVAGGLALSYLLVKAFSNDEKEGTVSSRRELVKIPEIPEGELHRYVIVEKEQHQQENKVWTTLSSIVTPFLITFAREQLLKFVEKLTMNNESDNDIPTTPPQTTTSH